MDRINHKISLDFQQRGAVPKIYANQNEIESRSVDIALFNAGSKWTAPAGVTVVMSYVKPDGIGGEYDHLPDDSPAWAFNTDRSEVVVKLAPQMFTTAGEVHCKVRFVTTASSEPVQVLSTFRFDLVCDRDSVSGESEPYFSVKSFDEMYQAIDEAKADAAEALAAGLHDITAEYVAAKASRPTLTPDAYLLEQTDGLYRINDEDGDVPFTARVVTDRAGAVSMDVVEYRQGDRIQRTYIDSTLITTVTMNSGDGAVEINPETLLGDLATALSNIAALQAENVALKSRVDAQGYELENLIVAGDGKIYTKSVDSSEAYTKIVPANALPYAALDSIGGKSVVLNQMVNFSTGRDVGILRYGITITLIDDTKIHVSGQSTSQNRIPYAVSVETTKIIPGRIYLIALSGFSDGITFRIDDSTGNSLINRAYSSIYTATKMSRGINYYIEIASGATVDTDIMINLIDLTQMFGAGNEPQVIEQAYAMGVPQSYIPYNAGEIVSADVQSVNASGRTPNPIPQAIRSLPGYGWSAGSVYNEVDYANKQFVQRVARVDLGSLDWYSSGDRTSSPDGTSGQGFAIARMDNAARETPQSSNPVMISWGLHPMQVSTYTSRYSGTENVGISTSGRIFIVLPNNASSSNATVKSILSGTYVLFALATPAVTDISALLPANFEVLPVEDSGTVAFHQANGTTLPVPATITFPVKIGGDA